MTLPLFPLANITGVSITAKFFTRVSIAQSGASDARNYGGGYWQVNVDLLAKERHEHDKIFAFLNARRGRYEKFRIIMPVYSYSKTDYHGQILVNGSGQSGSNLSIYGASSNTLILKAGDFVRIDGHAKVYQVTADVSTNGAGIASIPITPNLVATPNNNVNVIYRDVDWTVRNTTDDITLNLDQQIKAGWGLSLQEAWA